MIGAMGLIVPFAPTNAASAETTSPTAGLSGQAASDYVNDFTADLRQQGKNQAQVDAALANIGIRRLDADAAAGSALPDGTDSSSSNTDVSANQPHIYYDSDNRNYYTIFTWDWRNYNYMYEMPICTNCNKNIGGADGMGIVLNRSMLTYGRSVAHWGNFYYGSVASTTATDAGPYGVGFTRQDNGTYRWWTNHGWYYDLNIQHGQIVFVFDSPGGCMAIQSYGRYSHTWSSTSVTGFSIGPWSLGISWNTSSNRWYVTSLASPPVTVC